MSTYLPYGRWERIDPVTRCPRYYELCVEQDLWGVWVLTKIWGRCGSARGRVVHIPCDSVDAAISAYQDGSSRRQRRGYSPVAH